MSNVKPPPDEDDEVGFQAAIIAMRAEVVDEQVVGRIEQFAIAAMPETKSVLSTPISSFQRFRTLISASVALVILSCLALSALFWWMQASSAWAQVVNVVSEEPWMRLTLQVPEIEMPEGESFPNVVMWFDGRRKIAACDTPRGFHWLNIASEEASVFTPQTGRITIAKVREVERDEVQTMLMVLDRFEANIRSVDSERLKLVDSSIQDVIIDGRPCEEFTFRFEHLEGERMEQRMVVSVSQKTKHPVSIAIHIGKHNGGVLPRIYKIDYPKSGPADIYALGAPRDAPVLDLRSMAKFFPKRVAQTPDNYTAVEMMFSPGFERKFTSTAFKFSAKDGQVAAQQVDVIEVSEMSMKVHRGELKSPTEDPPALSWWAERVSRLKSTPWAISGYNFPHNRCYSPQGSEENYRTVHRSSLQGLEGCVELRGPKRSAWLDPSRNMIVRRWEHVSDDGTIHAAQYDAVIQDSKGTWFVQRWCNGHVSERGAELGPKVNGVSAGFYECHISFESQE